MKKTKSIIVLCLLTLGLFFINNKNDSQINHYSAQTSLLPTSILMSDEDPGSLHYSVTFGVSNESNFYAYCYKTGYHNF